MWEHRVDEEVLVVSSVSKGSAFRRDEDINKEGKINMSRHYSYRVVFSREDGEWVGLCTEFPSLSHLATDQVEAMRGHCDPGGWRPRGYDCGWRGRARGDG